MGFYLTKLLTPFALPPGNLLVVGLLGLIALRRFRRFGLTLVAVSFALLWMLSTPVVGAGLLRHLERFPVADPVRMQNAQALVVLGAGRRADAPEYGGDVVSARTLERLRYAAYLHRRTGLPLLVSGGRVLRRGPSEASLMKGTLENELGIPVQWAEQGSRNTAENASLSAKILRSAGIDRIVLVSHAVHLPRAVPQFERQGLTVTPAPTGFLPARAASPSPFDFLPQAGALAMSARALHEYVGKLWYSLRYRVE